MTGQRSEVSLAELRDMARYFHALRVVLRLRILVALVENSEMTVTELARSLRVSQPLVSFHLSRLRVAGLVQVRRAGREVYCSVDLAEVQRHQEMFVNMMTGKA